MSSAAGKKRATAADAPASERKRGKKMSLLNQHLCWLGKDQPMFDVIFLNAVTKCGAEGIMALYNCIMFAFYYFSYMLTEALVDEEALARGEDMYQDATEDDVHLTSNGKKACGKLVKTMNEAFKQLEELEEDEDNYQLNRPMKNLKHITIRFYEKLTEKPPYIGNAALRGLIIRKTKNDQLVPLMTLDDKDFDEGKGKYSPLEKNEENTAKCRSFFIKYLPDKEITVDQKNIVTLDNSVRIALEKQEAFAKEFSQQFPSNFHKKFKRLEGEMNAKINYLHEQQVYQIRLLEVIATKNGITSSDMLPEVSPTAPTVQPTYDSQKVDDERDEFDYESDDCEDAEASQTMWGAFEQKLKALDTKHSASGSSAMNDDDEDNTPIVLPK